MKEVVIVSGARTPIGTFGGSFKDISAPELGAVSIKEALKRSNLEPELVDEVYFGIILQAGMGAGPARQASIYAGIPVEKPATTINILCGSGLRSISLAAQTIMTNQNDIVVAGGMENMTRAPYLLLNGRYGYRMGNGKIEDHMLYDGLIDVFNNYHMGVTAENIAKEYGITREEQDKFGVRSQNYAEKAIKEGRFKDEIVPVEVPQRRGDPKIVDTDEHPRFGATLEGLSKIRPAF